MQENVNARQFDNDKAVFNGKLNCVADIYITSITTTCYQEVDTSIIISTTIILRNVLKFQT